MRTGQDKAGRGRTGQDKPSRAKKDETDDAREYRLQLRVSEHAVTEVLAQFSTWATAEEWPAAVTRDLHLALDELLVNLATHGCTRKGGCTATICLQATAERVTLEISDDGKAFNPLRAAPPDVSLPLQQRTVGGLGLHLVAKLMDDVSYRRAGGRNHVVLTRVLERKPRRSRRLRASA